MLGIIFKSILSGMQVPDINTEEKAMVVAALYGGLLTVQAILALDNFEE